MKRNKKNSTTIFIFSLIALALIIFGAWPLIEGIKKDSEDLISAKNDIANFNVQSIEIENFKNNYENYKTNLEKIDQLFINPSDPVEFIKFLEKTASECEVSMQVSLPPSLSNSETELAPNFIVFQLSLKGDFSNILLFINKIESGSYLIESKDLTIQNQENKNSASFNIKVFTKNESQI
jgi:hypothetical protein